MDTRHYGHMFWNLFLAWIPYLCSIWTCRIHGRTPSQPWRLLLPAALWLAWLPNASYLLTEFVHLQHVPTRAVWYDIALILAFAWTGCLLAIASLSMMHHLVRARWGELVGWLFVVTVAVLNGVGIYLGRFERWNSWDLLLNPLQVVLDIATRVIHPLAHPRFVGVTLFYAVFLLVCYLAFLRRDCTVYNGGNI